MQSVQPNLFTRPDTFFGVCEGLGEDLRFHPNILRIALAGLLFWSPALALGVYAALAVLVGATRWLVPNPRVTAKPATAESEAPEAKPAVEQLAAAEPMPLAA